MQTGESKSEAHRDPEHSDRGAEPAGVVRQAQKMRFVGVAAWKVFAVEVTYV